MKENIGTICKVLAYLSLIGGIIIGIFLAATLGVTVETYGKYYSYTEETRNVGLTLMYFIIGTVVGFIDFVIFFAASVILENQEQMMYKLNTLKSTAESSALSNNSEKSSIFKDSSKTDHSDVNGWKCPMCGQVNASYVGSCGCGYSKNQILGKWYKKAAYM